MAYQPARPRGVDGALAAAIVWFDAFIMNVDRTAKNPNLLVWHDKLWMIDHGAALYVHHAWHDPDRVAMSRFAMIKDHVLLPALTTSARRPRRSARKSPDR
ncbi:MAG: HipA family kinase [Thermomicrobiales bacterium]